MSLTLKPLAVAASVSSNGALTPGALLPVDCSGATRTRTLPTGVAAGVIAAVEKTDASTANALIITGKIRGVAAQTVTIGGDGVSHQGEVRGFISEGSDSWRPQYDHLPPAVRTALYASKATYDAFVDSVGDALDLKQDQDDSLVTADVDGARLLLTPGAIPGATDVAVFPGRPAQIIAQDFGSGSGVTNTTTETNLDSSTIDHTLIAAHDVLEYIVEGWLQNQTGSTSGAVLIKVYLGSTLLVSGSQTIATGATNLTRFEVNLKIHLASLTDQRVNGTLRYITEAIGAAAASVAAKATYVVAREAGQIAENLATDKALRVTVQFAAATANLAAKRDASYVERKPGI